MSIVSQTEQAYAVRLASQIAKPVIMCPACTDKANDNGEVISFSPLDGVELGEIEMIRNAAVDCVRCGEVLV